MSATQSVLEVGGGVRGHTLPLAAFSRAEGVMLALLKLEGRPRDEMRRI
jgi:hypothetical protein